MKTFELFKKCDRLLEVITTVVATCSFIATLFMMFLISTDVVRRWLGFKAINGCYEIVEMAMAVTVFSAFAYTQAKNGHVHVTMIISKFGPKLRLFLYAFTSLITTVVCGCICYAAAKQSGLSATMNQVTTVLYFPYSICYALESVFMGFFTITLAYCTVKNFIGIFCKPLGEEIQSHWF